MGKRDPLADDPVLGPIVEKSDDQLRDAGLLDFATEVR